MPCIAAGSAPPLTKAGTRTPPSQLEPLPPRRGWLEPAAWMGLPLSVAPVATWGRHVRSSTATRGEGAGW